MTKHIEEAIVIELTKQCNLNCGYCYLPEEDRTAKLDQDAAGIKAIAQCSKIIDVMTKEDITLLGVMILSAEATVLKAEHLAECINILHTRITNVEMISNGVRLSDDVYFNALISNVKDLDNLTINVTVDGYKEVHDRARDNSYDAAAKAVDSLISVGLLEGVNVVVGLEAIENPEKFKEWYKTFIVDREIECIPCCVEPPVIPTKSERIAIAKLLRDLKDMTNENEADLEKVHDTCDAVYINLDGTITTCTNDCGTKQDKEWILGRDSFKLMMLSRKTHIRGIQDECKTCDSSHLCHVYCHYHIAENGYAFDCIYHRDENTALHDR